MRGIPRFEFTIDAFNDSFEILGELVIPESQDQVSLTCKKRISLRVALTRCVFAVLFAVQLDDKATRVLREIEDVISKATWRRKLMPRMW